MNVPRPILVTDENQATLISETQTTQSGSRDNNLSTIARELADLRRTLSAMVDNSASKPQIPQVDEQRIAKLEGSYDALKVVRPMTITVVSVLLAALVFVLGFFATQISSINGKLDTIPLRLSEEFRALRAEMSAQTSAIANSITATRQANPPPPPPQIVVIPNPNPPLQSPPPPSKP